MLLLLFLDGVVTTNAKVTVKDSGLCPESTGTKNDPRMLKAAEVRATNGEIQSDSLAPTKSNHIRQHRKSPPQNTCSNGGQGKHTCWYNTCQSHLYFGRTAPLLLLLLVVVVVVVVVVLLLLWWLCG